MTPEHRGKRYEYHVVDHIPDVEDGSNLAEVLNAYGGWGWHLSTVTPHPTDDRTRYIFARLLTTTTERPQLTRPNHPPQVERRR